jgi:hypothetical protein
MVWIVRGLLCLFLLVLPDLSPAHRSAYDRAQYGGWRDEDSNCRDTRQEILIRDSRLPVLWRDEKKCVVAWGAWIDVYSGESINDPLMVDIDHVLSLQEIHEAGGWRWGTGRKTQVANWKYNLVAVSATMNRAKGARGLHEWMPPMEGFHCRYVEIRATVRVALRLQPLSQPESEKAAQILSACLPVPVNPVRSSEAPTVWSP